MRPERAWTEERSFEDDSASKAQMIGLEKKDGDFESFAVKRSEPGQDQTPDEAGLRGVAFRVTVEERSCAGDCAAGSSRPNRSCGRTSSRSRAERMPRAARSRCILCIGRSRMASAAAADLRRRWPNSGRNHAAILLDRSGRPVGGLLFSSGELHFFPPEERSVKATL